MAQDHRPERDHRSGDRMNDSRDKRTESRNGTPDHGKTAGFGGNRTPYRGQRPASGGAGGRPQARFSPKSGNRPFGRDENRREGGNNDQRLAETREHRGDSLGRSWADRAPGGSERRAGPYGRPAAGSDRPARGDAKPFRGGERTDRGGRPVSGGPSAPYRGNRDGRSGFNRHPGGNPVRKGPYGKPAERPGATDGIPARKLALDVIRLVTENGAYAPLALDDALQKCALSAADRRLAARLVYDTLDNRIYLDHALMQVMAKPDTDIKLMNVLRLGACQMLLEDRIPEMAATDTSVELCRLIGLDGLAGVCNGILRNLIRRKDELTFPDPETEPLQALSVRESVPQPLLETLVNDWGWDEAAKLAACTGRDRPMLIRSNSLRVTDEAFEQLLEKKVWEHQKGELPHTWQLRGMLNIGQDADFLQGLFSIQSEGSILACMAADPKRGQRVLDCCAAPGGKSCLMAEMMGDTGRVQAWELHEHRMKLIEAQVRRLRLESVRPMTRDALTIREDLQGTMDVVLLDAPCSGTGDMAEKPDVKYRVTPEGVQELARLQARLLETVSAYVKPGGTFVYSTCSVLKDENERQMAAFLAAHPEFEALPMPESFPEKWRRDGTGLQLLPHRDGCGFYICRMRRKRV